MDWNSIFKLPDAALAGYKRIPKTVLVKQAALTKHEQKTLEKVSSIRHFATVQKSTTKILPHVDGERDIQSIIFLHCETTDGSKAYTEIAALLHKCFPNPTVILFDGANVAGISVSLTRNSRSEKGAVVIDKIEGTGMFYTQDEAYKPFLGSLDYVLLPQDDLYSFLSEIAWKIKLSRSITALRFYPKCREVDREKFAKFMDTFDSLNKEAFDLVGTRRSSDLSMNEKAKIKIQQKEIDRQINVVVSSIKEICID